MKMRKGYSEYEIPANFIILYLFPAFTFDSQNDSFYIDVTYSSNHSVDIIDILA